MTLLPTLGGDGAQAFAVSNDGVIVGGSNTEAAGPYQACFWVDGTPTALVSQAASSFANDVNTRDQIVGTAATDPDGTHHAALWEDGVFTDLGTLPGGRVSVAWDISRDGEVVGAPENPATSADPARFYAAML